MSHHCRRMSEVGRHCWTECCGFNSALILPINELKFTFTSWLRFLRLRRGVGGRRGRRHGHVLVLARVTVMLPRVDTVLRRLTGRDGARDSRDLRQADGRTVGQRRVTTLEQERAVVHHSSSCAHTHTHLAQITSQSTTVLAC